MLTRPCRVRGLHVVAGGVLALLLLGAVAASAHDTWLLPASQRVPVGRSLALNLTSGMAFPADDFAIAPTRVSRAEVRLAGSTKRLASARLRAQALQYQWTPTEPGIATFAVQLAPKQLELTDPQVKEYFAEINASREIRTAWERMPLPKRWRERYAKHAKSFVRVDPAGGREGTDVSWSQPVGLELEIVPDQDPTRLTAGAELPVRILHQGAPVPGFAVGAQRERETEISFAQTDDSGRALIKLAKPGRWLLSGTLLRRSRDAAREWDSDFTTLTLTVAPRGP